MLRLIDCSLLVFCSLLFVVETTVPEHASAQSVRGLVFDVVMDEAISLATVTLISESGERVASAQWASGRGLRAGGHLADRHCRGNRGVLGSVPGTDALPRHPV
ncbi:MAG: hypothetical protein OSA81_10100 [Longimicrobiales bacterium]|nr:hypothetical protein [Longimicrobiales bacterium]